jgi:Coenzyme PQQ synthesis protein D (PqqD)
MTYSLAPYVTTTETEHGVVLLDERAGRYLQMNGTGAAILRHLLDRGDAASAVAELRDRYPAQADRVEADVMSLIDELRKAKVLTS